jgi:voltage-gated potassium channel Kch
MEQRLSRFLREPVSIRNAANIIVVATLIVVVVGGILMWVVDHQEYPNIGRGIWWALQTVTTVGYGDVTPQRWQGRVVGAFVMLEGIAFVAILVAAITSSFVARVTRERALKEDQREAAEERRIEAQLDDLSQRLERLEQLLTRSAGD